MDLVSLLSTEIFQLLALPGVHPALWSEDDGRSDCRCQCAVLPACREQQGTPLMRTRVMKWRTGRGKEKRKQVGGCERHL